MFIFDIFEGVLALLFERNPLASLLVVVAVTFGILALLSASGLWSIILGIAAFRYGWLRRRP